MSHLRYLNSQQAPFWDWIQEMGGAPQNAPWPHYGYGQGAGDEKKHHEDTDMDPPEYDGEDPPSPPEVVPEDPFNAHHHHEKLPDRSAHPGPSKEAGGEDDDDDGDDGQPKDDEPCCRRKRHGRCRRHGPGPEHGWQHHHHRGGPGPWWHARGRGGHRGHGRGGHFGGGPPFGGPQGPFPPHMFAGGFPFQAGAPCGGGADQAGKWFEMAKKFAERLGIDPAALGGAAAGGAGGAPGEGVDFTPAIDVFSTPTAYVVHVALPGAKKEDVAVHWDESKAALVVAGVVTRGVDEELANQLAVGERSIGVFSRTVRLGDRDHPARVDADSIDAKMDEGVLKVHVAKVEEFVEVKKVEVK